MLRKLGRRHLVLSVLTAHLHLIVGCVHTPVVLDFGVAPDTEHPRRAAASADGGVRRTIASRGGPLARCPKVKGTARIVGIGASTMGSAVGPMLKRILAPDMDVFVKAKSSSSVVRPDFFDWPHEMKALIQRFDPHALVVNLGTNDNQALKIRRGGGIEPDDSRWNGIFGERVDEILEIASGPGHGRAVIWIGPYAFRGKASATIGRRINAILTERINAFQGPAFFVDAYSATLDSRGKPIEEFLAPGGRKRVTARGIDGIHLKQYVVMELITLPTLRILANCLRPPVGD